MLGILTALVVSASADTQLAKLDWLAGRWLSEEDGVVSEEIWSGAAGDSRMGMWRIVAGGKVKLFEHLALVQGPKGLVLYLHHINADGTTWEEKTKPTTLPAVEQTDARTVFDGLEGGKRVRLTYEHKADGSLAVTLDTTEKGKPKQSVYTFTRR